MPSSDVVRSRRHAREAAFQALYQCSCGGSSIAAAIEGALARQNYSPDVAEFLRALADGAMTNVAELDARYAPYLKSGWTPERLSLIDRLVLRLAVYELWSMPQVPPKVTITEAVRLAKRFGSAESSGFVNAVLGRALEDSPKGSWEGEIEEVANESTPTLTLPQGGGNFGASGDEEEQEDDPAWTIRSGD